MVDTPNMYFIVRAAIEEINKSKLGDVEKTKMRKLVLSAFINDDDSTLRAVLEVF